MIGRCWGVASNESCNQGGCCRRVFRFVRDVVACPRSLWLDHGRQLAGWRLYTRQEWRIYTLRRGLHLPERDLFRGLDRREWQLAIGIRPRELAIDDWRSLSACPHL